jgi:hypothetical protein
MALVEAMTAEQRLEFLTWLKDLTAPAISKSTPAAVSISTQSTNPKSPTPALNLLSAPPGVMPDIPTFLDRRTSTRKPTAEGGAP